jgi:ATP-dependent DNA ligase
MAIARRRDGVEGEECAPRREIVAFDESGRPSFQQLQHRTTKKTAIRYFAFDLLHLNGTDLKTEALMVRTATPARGREVPVCRSADRQDGTLG